MGSARGQRSAAQGPAVGGRGDGWGGGAARGGRSRRGCRLRRGRASFIRGLLAGRGVPSALLPLPPGARSRQRPSKLPQIQYLVALEPVGAGAGSWSAAPCWIPSLTLRAGGESRRKADIAVGVRMTKARLLRLSVVLVSIFMILLIIVYWDNVGTAHFYLHTSFSRPHSPGITAGDDWEALPDVDEFLAKLLSSSLKQNSSASQKTEQLLVQSSSKPVVSNLEENVRGYDWSTHNARNSLDQEKLQVERQRTLREFCANSSFAFPTKERSFDDIPNYELNHLIVDDRHGIIYCYVPKVACTNWKRVMIVLSESLLDQGVPYRNPLDIPREHVHNTSTHLTFNKFWRRYGKFSRHLMKIKLKKYTKFLFVRDPFVRLISAFRSKFELENEEFYRRFAIPMLKLYSNHTNLPTSVSEAFRAGLKVSFSDFIQYLLDPRTEKMAPFNEHWRQVYRLCHPCQIDYDFIGKLETLDEDAAYLLQLLKVDRLLHFPPSYRNRTASSWEDDWFAKIPLAWRQQLYKLYEADFVLFGYPKPENLLKD